MNIAAIVQARMDSVRLPGKAMCEMAGKPVLQYLLESLQNCCCLDGIIVATSVKSSDKPIVDLCDRLNVKYYRGDVSNVASRFAEILDKYGFEAFVRASADSPLLDCGLVKKAVTIFKEGKFEIVTNVLKRTYPSGQSVEVMSAKTFKDGYKLIKDPDDLEHVTKYFYRNSGRFKIFNIESSEDFSAIDLSLDVKEDFDVMSSIAGLMDKPHWRYGMTDIVSMYKKALKDVKARQLL